MANDLLTLTSLLDSLVNLKSNFKNTHNIQVQIDEEIVKTFNKIKQLSNAVQLTEVR